MFLVYKDDSVKCRGNTMIVPWLLKLPRVSKGKWSPSHRSGGCLIPLSCSYPFHPPMLPHTHLPVPQRHVSSGLENKSHRRCLTTPLAGKLGHCLAIQLQAEGPALAFPLVPHLKTAELTGLHQPIRRCVVPMLL